jgi:hypothetical protein
MSNNDIHPTLEQVRCRLPGAVLLACNGNKHPIHEAWQTTSYAETQKPEYQEELKSAVAIGVLLGPPSGSLVVADCDTEVFFNAMVLLNTERNATLVTRGVRGGSFWYWIQGNYPEKIYKLVVEPTSRFAQGGKVQKNGLVQIGEFRGARGQSIICGQHPAGIYYTWPSDREPRILSFLDIIWPYELDLPWIAKKTVSGPHIAQSVAQPPTSQPTTTSSVSGGADNETTSLLADAIAALSVSFLWKHFGYPERRTNPVSSPFRVDHKPSFSIYSEEGQERWYDHGAKEGGDSFDFYKQATGLSASAAFVPFVELAGLGDRLRKNRVRVAMQKGSGAGATQNKEALILPCGPVPYIECASNLFPVLAQRYRYFVRGQFISEIAYKKPMKDKQLHDVFQPLEADAFRSRLEKDFDLLIWRKELGQLVLKPALCTLDSARVLLKSDEAIQYLPAVATLSALPVLTAIDGVLHILTRGYHDVHGGIYVTHGEGELILPDLASALALILDAIKDFDFLSPSDKSRCVASFLSPALHAGHLLGEVDYPIDIGEADKPQAGKTFRFKLINAIYGETPYIISNRRGGVGSLDESISSALVSGLPVILFENFRGFMDSPLLETCLRGVGIAPARIPHRGEVQLPTTHINWQLSSNGIEATRDLGNRSIIVRIAKHASDFQFAQYPEGNILPHIKANQLQYLGAVFRVIQEWWEHGRKRSKENRHDFTEWVQTLDWIVQEICGLAPLLEGHTEAILRVSDPALSWLRQVALAVEEQSRLSEALLAREIIDICQALGIEVPGFRGFIGSEQLLMHVGKILGRIFREESETKIDRYQIRKDSRKEHRPLEAGGDFFKHYYWFEKR